MILVAESHLIRDQDNISRYGIYHCIFFPPNPHDVFWMSVVKAVSFQGKIASTGIVLIYEFTQFYCQNYIYSIIDDLE